MLEIPSLDTVQFACQSELQLCKGLRELQVDFHVGTARSSNARKGRGVTLCSACLHALGGHNTMGVQKGSLPEQEHYSAQLHVGRKISVTNSSIHLSCSSLLSPERPGRCDQTGAAWAFYEALLSGTIWAGRRPHS